jgi:hypothetical protein
VRVSWYLVVMIWLMGHSLSYFIVRNVDTTRLRRINSSGKFQYNNQIEIKKSYLQILIDKWIETQGDGSFVFSSALADKVIFVMNTKEPSPCVFTRFFLNWRSYL